MEITSKADGYEVARNGIYPASSSGLILSYLEQRLDYMDKDNPSAAIEYLGERDLNAIEDLNTNIYRFRLESIANAERRNRRLDLRMRDQVVHSVNARQPDMNTRARKLKRDIVPQMNEDKEWSEMHQIEGQERQMHKKKSGMHVKDQLFASIRDYFELKCLKALKKIQKRDNSDEDYDLVQNDHQEILPIKSNLKAIRLEPIKQLLIKAMTDDDTSKDILKSLEYLDDASLTTIVDELCGKVSLYIVNVNTCFILKWLARRVPRVAEACSAYILQNLEYSLRDTHTCRLAYTLCIHYSEFREGLLARFNVKPFRLIDTLPKAVLVGLLMTHAEDLSDCQLIYELLEIDPTVVKQSFYCRAFAAYMNRCSLESLARIAELFKPQMAFLLSDNFGNFLLQTFFIRNCAEGIALCRQAVIYNYRKVFTKRHSRYILFRALNQDDTGKFSIKLLTQVIRSSEYVLLDILGRNTSNQFLLYALSVAGEHMETSLYIEEMKVICKQLKRKARKDIRIIIDAFLTDIKILARQAQSSKYKTG